MKILVIGLDCAAPEIVLHDRRLVNMRALMERGCYGPLESIVPPITVPAWMCMATSRDPGALGIYGFRNRTGYGYDALGVVNARSITAPAMWDVLGAAGWRTTIVGVPPSFPPRRVNGISVGCFLTPDTATMEYTHPASIGAEIRDIVGDYPVDVHGFRTDDKRWLRDQIHEMTRKHFAVVRHLMTAHPWDYFQFVEIGVDRMHHGFWKFHDPQHRQHVPGNEFESAITDYYLYVDEEIGRTLELVDDDTAVLLVSDHGAQRLDGGFCVNEWLRREGLLVLKEEPAKPTPFKPSMVDWSRTRVWSEGGYYARIFLNVAGREPQGTIAPEDYEAVREDIAGRLRALDDDRGRPMGTDVFRPEEIYQTVNNVAPDLIAHFGGLYWRSIGGVGYDTLHVQENDTGPDDCNHAQHGVFILAAAGMPLRGPVGAAHLLDIAPTLLELAGVAVPAGMQGRSLLCDVVTTR